MTTMEPLMLYRAPDSTEAALLANELESHGIPTQQAGALELTYGGLGLEAQQVEIWVPAERAAEGRRVIQAYYALHGGAATPWVCPDCGESNASGFEVCWQCARPKAAAPDATA